MALIGLALAAVLAGSIRLPPPQRRARARSRIDVLLVARLLAVSLASGLTLGRALADVARRLPEAEVSAIDDVLIRANRDGLTRSLAETTGPLEDLAERLAKAQVTGAPIGPALDAFIATLHDARRFQAVEEARTIGVKLVLPLTLLLLPGFLTLVVAPFVLEQLEDLLGAAIP